MKRERKKEPKNWAISEDEAEHTAIAIAEEILGFSIYDDDGESIMNKYGTTKRHFAYNFYIDGSVSSPEKKPFERVSSIRVKIDKLTEEITAEYNIGQYFRRDSPPDWDYSVSKHVIDYALRMHRHHFRILTGFLDHVCPDDFI